MNGKILVIDFGSQYTQLIARKIRELNVYCEIVPFNNFRPEMVTGNAAVSADSSDSGCRQVKGVILSGSPRSVRDADAPRVDLDGIKGRVPLLGICYGAQYLAQFYGGNVEKCPQREYGRAVIRVVDADDPLLKGVSPESQVWMSHGDSITSLPASYRITASTEGLPVASYRIDGENTWALQFHPEVHHSVEGKKILGNFVLGICGCEADWTPANFIDSTVAALREKIGGDKVVLGLSGGVDSSVAAVLLHRAIGDRLHCIFVDSGLMRKGEAEEVMESYKGMGLNVRCIDASEKFLADLAGVTEPEAKRKIIGRDFVVVFDAAAKEIENVKWLGQGTIYPDVVESAKVNGTAVVIKSHHNVGGLPDKMNLKVVEPLKLLFKDEVRRVGAELGIPQRLLGRHPFPGPGLGIRVIGEVTAEKLEILRNADRIFTDILREESLYDKIWQAGAMLLPVQSVGVMGDERTYERCVALRAVTSVDGMTADWAQIPYDVLARLSTEIINRVRGVNRVVYDISSKPPATIEWE